MKNILNLAGLRFLFKDLNFKKDFTSLERDALSCFIDKGIKGEYDFVFDIRALPIYESANFLEKPPDLYNHFSNYKTSTFNHAYTIFQKIYFSFFKVLKKVSIDWKNQALTLSPYGLSILDISTSEISFLYRPKKLNLMVWRGSVNIVKKDFLDNRDFLYTLNMLRFPFRLALLHAGKNKGVMLHGASLELMNKGYVFLGNSGSGKTTVTKLLNPTRILSDEIAIIRYVGRSYKIFSNPWWNRESLKGRKPSYDPADLKAIFFIEKSNKTSLEIMDHKKVIIKLVNNEMSLKFERRSFEDKKTARISYSLLYKILKKIPVFNLKIKKEPAFREKFISLCIDNKI